MCHDVLPQLDIYFGCFFVFLIQKVVVELVCVCERARVCVCVYVFRWCVLWAEPFMEGFWPLRLDMDAQAIMSIKALYAHVARTIAEAGDLQAHSVLLMSL